MNPRNLALIAVGCAALVAVYAFLDTSPASSPGASRAAPLTAPQQAIGDASTDIAPQPAAEQPLARPAPADADTSVASPEASSGQAQEQQQHQAHTVASQRFKALSKPEQYSERKTALAKLIAGDELALGNQVALSERSYSRREQIKRSKDLAESQIDVNGMRFDVAQKGILVDNRLAVYVTAENHRMIDDLRGMAGVRAVKAVFPGKLDAVRNTPRDPSGWYHIELAASKERIPAMVKALNSFPEVGVAEAAFERRIKLDGALISDLDDPLKTDQWHLTAAQVPAAWEHLQANDLPAGGLGLTVAVIDTGVDYLHPDLVDNMWVNTLEVPGNGMDDDDNGFIDDIHGVAVVSESFSHSGDPNDDHGHGTHVAGIIAATGGNDIGGVGIAYNARIMAIKAAQYSGVLTTVDIAEAILYAVDNGADIINMSFGGYGRSLLEEDALAIAYSQAVLVAAAGNNGKPNQFNCLGAPMYPAAHPWVLGVMARTEQPNAKGDYKAGFSNWDCVADNGLEYELMAPGTAIWSTLPGEGYAAWSGTSMAAPVVAGIAALARTKWPDKSVYSSRFIMGQAAATGPDLQAFTPLNKPPVFYREANAFNAVTILPAPALSYEEHWLFDETTRSDANDSDGRIDSGETVELAIVIRNRWGKADNVVATLSTPSGAS
ncbi:MAG: S8 family serine peptidase, partial [Gammaproteobacteria bacterium]|nr:S8 family serine peptidase [Gammaproteobacteria bacterium]